MVEDFQKEVYYISHILSILPSNWFHPSRIYYTCLSIFSICNGIDKGKLSLNTIIPILQWLAQHQITSFVKSKERSKKYFTANVPRKVFIVAIVPSDSSTSIFLFERWMQWFDRNLNQGSRYQWRLGLECLNPQRIALFSTVPRVRLLTPSTF